MTSVLILLSFGLVGFWMVRLADETHAKIPTCRYRELAVLSRKVDQYSAAYFISGVAAFATHTAGVAVTLAVFGYAAYCRFR